MPDNDTEQRTPPQQTAVKIEPPKTAVKEPIPTAAATEPDKTPNKTDMNKKYIYIGPNMYKYGLFTNQIYNGGLPKIVDELAKELPLMKQLFAPLNEIADYQEAVKVKGTPQYLAIQQLKGGK